jgi:hypothetical protein
MSKKLLHDPTTPEYWQSLRVSNGEIVIVNSKGVRSRFVPCEETLETAKLYDKWKLPKDRNIKAGGKHG